LLIQVDVAYRLGIGSSLGQNQRYMTNYLQRFDTEQASDQDNIKVTIELYIHACTLDITPNFQVCV
jgi:hypothetical protein